MKSGFVPNFTYFLFYPSTRLRSRANRKDRHQVKILFYARIAEDPETGFEGRLKGFVPADRLEVYRSIRELSQRLEALYNHETIVVLQARDMKRLMCMVSLRDQFQGVRIILLVPDREEETLLFADRLRRRFLINNEGDFSDVMSVLQKMLDAGR